MRRILTTVLTFYWTVAFAAMAGACVVDEKRGIAAAFHLLGSTHASNPGGMSGLVLAALFAVAFSLASLLFLWSLITDVAESYVGRDADDVLRVALAFGGCVFAALLMTAAALAVSGIFAAVALHLTAMLTSYLAVRTEQVSRAIRDAEGGRLTSRLMAASAARQYSPMQLAGNVHPIRGDR